MSKNRERQPKRADLRAMRWIRQAERNARGGGSDNDTTLQPLVAYTVRRTVLSSTPRGIFERPDIMDFLDGEHGAKVFPSVGLSLINPNVGKKLAYDWRDRPDDIREMLETVSDSLPSLLSGCFYRSIILGTPKNKPGPRFVGYTLNEELHTVVKGETQQLLEEVQLSSPIKRTPHITLFETPDQELALELKQRLGHFLTVARVPLELGPAEAVPISNVDRRYHGIG